MLSEAGVSTTCDYTLNVIFTDINNHYIIAISF